MKIVAIADLHITDTSCPEWQLLLDFLKHPEVQSAERVVLLGDIFDLLVGAHHFYLQLFEPFFMALRQLGAKGIQIDYFEGNHDFAFEELFQNFPNVRIHQHAANIQFEGVNYYFGHGDELEVDNTSYLWYSCFIRSWPMRWLINAVPASLIQTIGKFSSRYSRKRGSRKIHLKGVEKRVSRFLNYVEQYLEHHPVDILVCGHSHFACLKKFGEKIYANPGRCGHTKQFIKIEGREARFITLL